MENEKVNREEEMVALHHISAELYRIEAILQAAQESAPEDDRFSQAQLLIESAREMVWNVHNDVEELAGDERIDRPDGLI